MLNDSGLKYLLKQLQDEGVRNIVVDEKLWARLQSIVQEQNKNLGEDAELCPSRRIYLLGRRVLRTDDLSDMTLSADEDIAGDRIVSATVVRNTTAQPAITEQS